MKSRLIAIMTIVACLFMAAMAEADVTMPKIFSDNMVLQQELPIAVWGKAAPGEAVTVTLVGDSKTATADASGKWRVDLPPKKADGKTHSLVIRGKNIVTLENVVLGEVWLCSGQSNMNRGVEIKEDDPDIRLFWIDGSTIPQKEDLGWTSGWVASTDEGLASAAPIPNGRFKGNPRKSFTEVGYVFGRQLHEELKVPVGLIKAAFGGSQVHAWTPKPGIEEEYPFGVEATGGYLGHREGLLYQSMIHGMVPLTMRGVIWYQGENDGRNRAYHDDKRAWIESWRELWSRPDMPFYFVQIAPTTYAGGAMQYVWESQVAIMESVPHTGMAVSNDILPGTAVKIDEKTGYPKAGGSNPHPPNKHIVAQRLANIALVKTYGRPDRVLYGPMFDSYRQEGNKIHIKLKHIGSGLATRDGQPPNWFLVAEELPKEERHPDSYHHYRRLQFAPAKAQITGKDTVTVHTPAGMKSPKYVTFAWDCEARHNLINKEGLPAVSFRVKIEDEIGWKASGKGGAVAAGGSKAVAAGIRLLDQNGNAADAAVATLLALSVTDYGWFSIGGEVPLLIYDAKRREVKVLCGAGRAPLDPKAIEWYYANDIPSRGSMKASLVPGAVDLCITALRLYGTKTFRETVAPTLALLDKGDKDWHPRLARTLRKLVAAETNAEGTREEKLIAARDCFYKGEVADELEAWYIETGAFLRKRDLAAHRTLVEDPVTVDYRGYKVHKCGPWTQGPVLCQTLRLLEGFDLKAMGHLSADQIHATVEALKLGFADRDEYYADPLFADVPLDALLSDRYTALRRPLIDMARASQDRRPGDPRRMQPVRAKEQTPGASSDIPVQDTTTCVVADRFGNVVAATPSCNLLSNKPGPSGVNQGNRVRSLNTTPGHPNRVEPGKRPRITLTPTLVTKDGKPVLAISVAGGDLQDQTTLNVLLAHVDFGLMPERAVTAPRFSTAHQQNSFDPNPDRVAAFGVAGSLQVNAEVSEQVQRELSDRGHKLKTASGPIAYPIMIYIDPKSGMIHAAGDPKARRHAAALP